MCCYHWCSGMIHLTVDRNQKRLWCIPHTSHTRPLMKTQATDTAYAYAVPVNTSMNEYSIYLNLIIVRILLRNFFQVHYWHVSGSTAAGGARLTIWLHKPTHDEDKYKNGREAKEDKTCIHPNSLAVYQVEDQREKDSGKSMQQG